MRKAAQRSVVFFSALNLWPQMDLLARGAVSEFNILLFPDQ